MENNNQYSPADYKSQYNVYTPEIIREYNFSDKERFMAFFAVVLGFLSIKLFIVPFCINSDIGLGCAAFLLCTTIFVTAFNSQLIKPTSDKIIRIALCIIFSINVFISSNVLIQSLDVIFVILIIAYDKLADSDSRLNKIRNRIISDVFSALIIRPFNEYGACGSAIKNTASRSKMGNNIKNALLGLVIAVPSTVAVCGLLMSADYGFESIIEGLLTNGLSKAVIAAIQFVVGIPVGFYIFGMCYAAKNSENEINDNDDCLGSSLKGIRFLPSVAGVFSAMPLCIMYVIFFFSQLSYFLSSFASKLPSDMDSYSQYARQGFFELCMVAVINLAVIIALTLFCKRNEDDTHTAAIKATNGILCVFTLLLIATAVSKMVMYINVYGLTLLRIYTTWFMLLLAVVFIGILLTIIRKNTNLAKITVTAFTVMFAALSFCNVDGLIAEYNADRYINGTLQEYDIDMISTLSTGAVPAAARVMPYLDADRQERLKIIISDMLHESDNDNRTITLYDIIAAEHFKNL